jgi:MoaA/NifB/PqqE/SkfB family radical SAM enzyme
MIHLDHHRPSAASVAFRAAGAGFYGPDGLIDLHQRRRARGLLASYRAVEEGVRLMENLAAAHPGAVLILTGGEPLTRPDVLELARAGTALGLQMALSVDVGRLLTPELCAEIGEAGVKRVSFSLHYPDAERCDRFTSTPGFFAGALSGLRNLRDAGVPFQLHTSVMRSNAALLPRMHELACELGASGWELFFLMPTGRGRGLAHEELPPVEQERVLR